MCNSILKKLGILSLVLVGAGVFSTQSFAGEPRAPTQVVVATPIADRCAPPCDFRDPRRDRVEDRRERAENRDRREDRRDRRDDRRDRREDRRECR